MSNHRGKRRKAVFPVNGQGVLKYTIRKKSQLTIFITPDKQKIKHDPEDIESKEVDVEKCFDTDNFISLTVGEEFAKFHLKMEPGEDKEMKPGEDKDLIYKHKKNIGIEPKEIVTYWFSYDRDALVLKYGKGHTMEQTTKMTFDFLKGKTEEEKKKIRKHYWRFFNAAEKKYIVVENKKLQCDDDEKGDGGLIDVEAMLLFSPNPLVQNFPPLVIDSGSISLFDLDRDQYMLSSSLPKPCIELYDNIKGLQLEFPGDPLMKLSDAIRYSIETKGMTLYNKLKEKEDKFKYLRVTLGPDKRTAPGIPYVLEIWPKHCGSLIHNHGGSCAIIKNLYGQITVNIFNKFTQPPDEDNMKPIIKFDLKQDDVTWIDQNWYQTHKLFNNTNDFCATIQCYRYDYTDTIHWPQFDYVNYVEGKDKFELEEFVPDSDFTFVHLRSIVLKEYKTYLEG